MPLTCDPGVLDRRLLESTCALGAGVLQRVRFYWEFLTYGEEGATVVPLHASPQRDALRRHRVTAAFRPSCACPVFPKETVEVTSHHLYVLFEEKARGYSLCRHYCCC